ncbi:hypothetical protein MCOR29_004642 [Pyricularia oryzae]|nr:hypothetical protein MCOR29_004642 [Pyricularia oryzae]
MAPWLLTISFGPSSPPTFPTPRGRLFAKLGLAVGGSVMVGIGVYLISLSLRVCRTCLVPGCTTTVAVSKPCGCDNLATTSIDLGCDSPNVCNRIGCKTVYDIKTAAC